MNYIQILRDSIRILRFQRLIWVFAFISFLPSLLSNLFYLLSGNPIHGCIYLTFGLASLLLSLIANGGLIYLVHQSVLDNQVFFSGAWQQGRSRLFRIIGSLCIASPALIIYIVTYFFLIMGQNLFASTCTTLIPWCIAAIMYVFISSFTMFCLSAIMIDNVKPGSAVWTGLLITLNNFFRVFIISGSIYLIQNLVISLIMVILTSDLFMLELPKPLTFDFSAFQRNLMVPAVLIAYVIINLFLMPLSSVALILCYLKFKEEISYPALSKQQSTL